LTPGGTVADMGADLETIPGPPAVVDIIVDGASRLGPLSYRVPPGMVLQPGAAVKVPFGKRTAYGFVLGPGSATKATRDVLESYGKRVTAAELDVVRTIADRHLCQVSTIAARLAPREGKAAQPLEPGPVQLARNLPRPAGIADLDTNRRRRFYVCAPLVSQPAVAAREALRISEAGQVLVLCPTVESVDAVMACFASGAVRLDAAAPRGSWGAFAQGSAAVGVGTRAAALYSADRLAGIVVVEEDHPGHRERHQPHTHARDLAAERAARFGSALVLIGSNPTAMGLGAKVKAFPVGGPGDWPRLTLIDRNDLVPEERALPPALVRAVAKAIERGQAPVVITDGSAARWLCVRCAAIRKGPSSSRAGIVDTAEPCERCATTRVRIVGWDAARVKAAFPKGTRAVAAKDLAGISDAGVVVICELESRINAAGLDPDGPLVHLVMAAARAAGRGGRVLAASRDCTPAVLADLFTRRDLMAVAKRTWATAKEHRLPPFERQVQVYTAARPVTRGWPGTVLGPRQVGKEWEVLVRLDDADLPVLAPHVARLRRRGKVRITVT
jgi:primosomal protein N'